MSGWDRNITLLVPIVMFGWIPFTAALFYKTSNHKAILISVIGGIMFLPQATYSVPGLPEFSKRVIIALSIFIGSFFSQKPKEQLNLSVYDIPMALWCFIVPIGTSLTNNLGFYDGISGSLNNILNWGIFYWAGRKYFSDREAFHEICMGLILGGLIYVPFILFELRMAPTLSQRIYGFFPHSWIQHIRYEGYRPAVFMSHGLMVSLWMALSTTVAYWYWRSKRTRHIAGIPMSILVILLIITTILCKSANGLFFLALGIITFSLYKKSNLFKLLQISLLIIPIYLIFRVFEIISIEDIQLLAAGIFNDERVASLTIRLMQERAFGERALQRPLWGWGGYRRAWPVDPVTGEETVSAIDSEWIILFSHFGIMGLLSVFLSLLLGPWFVLRSVVQDRRTRGKERFEAEKVDLVVISLIVVFFVIDSLLNASRLPIYILSAGALIGIHVREMKSVHQDNIIYESR